MGFKAISTSRSAATTAVSKQATVINSSSGFAVAGSTITANTTISLNVNTPGQAPNTSVAGLSISSINYLNANGTISTANAVSTAGGNIKINGAGFTSPMTVVVGGTTISNANVNVANTSAIIANLGSASPGNASVYAFNSSGTGAQLATGIQYSGVPTWTTTLASFINGTAANVALVASSDSTLTYTLQSGSSLPTGISLISTGYLSGTATGYSETTTSTAVLVATDVEGQAAQQTITWTVQVSDPQFYLTSLLLNGDTGNNIANNATNNTFLDASTNNFTVTRAGNTTQGTLSPFSQTGWSNYLNGSTDYLTVPNNAALQMGSGDFTIEFWINYSSIASYQTPFSKGYTAAGDILLQTGNGDGKIIVYLSGTAAITEASGATVGQWYHYALVRSGTTVTLYRNGVSRGTATSAVNFNTTDQLGIGATGKAPGGGAVGQYPVSGYISNLRIVKGTAVYTSAFTTPITPLTAIANTSLLTCQSNRFIDNSTNAFVVTPVGTPSVQAYSPFAPSAAYSASTIGGSAYFDGTGDYVSVPSSAALSIGSSNFTFEGWFNWSGGTANWTLFSKASSYELKSDTNRWVWQLVGVSNVFITSWTPNIGQWYHIALVRNATVTTLYINGVSYTTGTSATATSSASALQIGSGSATFNGYMSNVRFVVGTAIYTTNFTPPTAPVTAVANTQLLLNYTNGGIVDAHSSNVLETLGDTKLSTAVKKFGTASIAFDGTGDYLYQPSTVNYQFFTGDYTVECWINPTNFASQGVLFDFRTTNGASGGALQIYTTTGGVITVYGGSSTATLLITAGAAITSGTWTHVALSRSGTSTKLFINGTQTGLTATDATNYGLGALWVGTVAGAGNNYFNGYLDDVRITKFARYTANFTAPISAFLGQ